MAGTIRKVTTNSLMYSNESSGILSDSVTISQSASPSCSDSVELETMEFDLRDEPDSGGNAEILIDAPVENASEAVVRLEENPLLHTTIRRPSEEVSQPTKSQTISRRDPSRLAKLVEQLVDSPKSMRSKVRNPVHEGSPIFPVSRVRAGPQGVAPLGIRNRHETHTDKRVNTKQSRAQVLPRADRWICPDSWIPNHECDTFCWETLRHSLH
jgi:hypothetical protein